MKASTIHILQTEGGKIMADYLQAGFGKAVAEDEEEPQDEPSDFGPDDGDFSD